MSYLILCEMSFEEMPTVIKTMTNEQRITSIHNLNHSRNISMRAAEIQSWAVDPPPRIGCCDVVSVEPEA